MPSFYAARQYTNPTGIGLHFAQKGVGGVGVGVSGTLDPYLRRRVVLYIVDGGPCLGGAGTVVPSFYAARQFTNPTGIGLHFAHKGVGGVGVGVSHVLDP